MTKDRRKQILGAQTNIFNISNLMSKENVNHTSFPEVYGSASSEDKTNNLIDVDKYRCSQCGLDSADDNDLIIMKVILKHIIDLV